MSNGRITIDRDIWTALWSVVHEARKLLRGDIDPDIALSNLSIVLDGLEHVAADVDERDGNPTIPEE